MSGTEWTFSSRYGYERTTVLSLYWEVNGDPMSDDYEPEEITADRLLMKWARKYCPDPSVDPWAPIYWFVSGYGVFDAAPFQREYQPSDPTGFLRHYGWPVDERGERLQWSRLPVVDKLWHPSGHGRHYQANKGGFIQEATGWKPSPMQDRVHVPDLLAAAGYSSSE